MGALKPKHIKKLEEFMDLLKPAELAQVKAPSETPAHAALRFLRGWDFSKTKALKAFTDHIQWRKDFNIDERRVRDSKENVNFDISRVLQFYPCGVKGMDRCGRPLFIKLYGHIDVSGMENAASPTNCATWETINVEKLRFLSGLHSTEVGWHVEDTCVLLDLEGMSLGMFNSFVRASFAASAKQIEPNYPENLGLSIIINAPWYIKGIWSVIKIFLKQRTHKKFILFGYDYKDKLTKYIDPAYLPVEYGGTGEKGFHSIKEILAGNGLNLFENKNFLSQLVAGEASFEELYATADSPPKEKHKL